MTTGNIGEHPHEIIIVKHRGGDHDEGHHGGVWKIAFADFMTAMMCFFLVMWLINAASEQTKATVASYFNPVKLIDRNSSRKGLEDIGDGPNALGAETERPEAPQSKDGADGTVNGGPQQVKDSDEATEKKEYSDEHLFSDPYAVLAEIVGETGVNQNISAKGDGGMQTAGPATGASGGESYRDPFAPDFWTKQVEPPIETEPPLEKPATSQHADAQAAGPSETGPQAATDLAATVAKVDAAGEAIAAAPEAEDRKPIAELFRPKDEAKPEEKSGPTSEAAEKAKEIEREIAEAMGTGEKLGNGLEVVATDKGVTISVTDEFDFGMFEIGSALPRKQLVLAMEKIGKVLSAQKGAITINGHTDARPFKSESYDNWRLSTARAHSAYYMLARAGLDEKRIKEVAGFADRELKVKNDPLAAANRRIEIFLEVGG